MKLNKKRHTRKRHKKGGAKLRHESKQGIKAIYDMINSQSSTLSILTTSSLKGFMVKLDVNPEASEFYALSTTTTRFQEPIVSYVLKFVVISNSVMDLDDFDGNKKQTETRRSFIDEAELQQAVWENSIIGGTPEICPSVANLSIFNNNSSKVFLDFLINKANDTGLKDLFIYLKQQLGFNKGIGVLTMPNIIDSTTLSRVPENKKIEAKIDLSAQLIRLFIEICVVHFDLHSGNALIVFDSNGDIITSRIIDFGRASNIIDESDDEFLPNKPTQTKPWNWKGVICPSKEEIYDKIEEFLDRFNELKELNDINQENQFVLDVLRYLIDLDKKANFIRFRRNPNNPNDVNKYQMRWLDQIINLYSPNSVEFNTIFRRLKVLKELNPKGITEAKIKEYKERGIFSEIDNPDYTINTYQQSISYIPDNIDLSQRSEESQNSLASSQESQNSFASSQESQNELVFVNSEPIVYNDRLAQLSVTASASASDSPIDINSNTASASSVAIPSASATSLSTFFISNNKNLSIPNNIFTSNSQKSASPIASDSATNNTTYYVVPDHVRLKYMNKRLRLTEQPSSSLGGKKRKSTNKKNKKNKKRRVTKKRYSSK